MTVFYRRPPIRAWMLAHSPLIEGNMPNNKVALAGLGAIGSTIARALDTGIADLKLVAVAEAQPGRAQSLVDQLKTRPEILRPGDLAGAADIIVESASASAFDEIANPAIEAGKTLVPCSIGALLFRPALITRAAATGARIVVPTGAIAGLDAVRAVAQGRIERVVLESRKPPAGLVGVPYLENSGIDVRVITEARKVFSGDAAAAVRHFPANANVAAALALAGVGPQRTEVEIWADPAVTRNVHTIRIEAESARLTIVVENIPSDDNPKTSKLAALSIIACLSGLRGSLKVGS
jgi:aspartate dehydrogenase